MNLNNAHFACKEANMQAMQTNLPTRGAKEPYYIAESIELPEAEWTAFTKGFCKEWPWLKDFNGRFTATYAKPRISKLASWSNRRAHQAGSRWIPKDTDMPDIQCHTANNTAAPQRGRFL